MSVENPQPSDGLINAGFYRDRDQILVLGDQKLEMPSSVYDNLIGEKKDPVDTAIAVIKTGILADRGVLVQPIGGEELTVTVKDAALIPYPNRFNLDTNTMETDTKTTINLAANTARFVAQTSKMFPTNATNALINQWFLKALSLWLRYGGDDGLMHFRIDENTTRDFTFEGIEETWNLLGFPESEIESSGKRPFTKKTLFFKETTAKPVDTLPTQVESEIPQATETQELSIDPKPGL